MLHRIWAEQAQALTYKSWAVQLNPNPIDKKFWDQRGVDVLDTSLEKYIERLAGCLGRLQPSGIG